MWSVGQAEFDALVAQALDDLPTELAALMDNVAIFLADELPEEPELLGLYEGIPLTERDSGYVMAMPDRITIFRTPIMRVCDDAAEVRRQVQVTVVHEVAHHFGIDDERLHELGYA